ncbi:MAG: hypothetical protein ACRDQ5_15600, partial [Sciscionella sp.]
LLLRRLSGDQDDKSPVTGDGYAGICGSPGLKRPGPPDHLSPEAYADTVKRHARLTAAGLFVVHTVPARLRREPRAVLEELRRAHEHAAARPRPPVTAQATG